MNWLPYPDNKPGHDQKVLATGFIDNLTVKGRWHCVANFYNGKEDPTPNADTDYEGFFDDLTGEEFLTPTHYAIIEDPTP